MASVEADFGLLRAEGSPSMNFGSTSLVTLCSTASGVLRRYLWDKEMIKPFPGSEMRCNESQRPDKLDLTCLLACQQP